MFQKPPGKFHVMFIHYCILQVKHSQSHFIESVLANGGTGDDGGQTKLVTLWILAKCLSK
jgi:hypothetical protein